MLNILNALANKNQLIPLCIYIYGIEVYVNTYFIHSFFISLKKVFGLFMH